MYLKILVTPPRRIDVLVSSDLENGEEKGLKWCQGGGGRCG